MKSLLQVFTFLIVLCATSNRAHGNTDTNLVYVFEISEEIAQPVWFNLQMALEEAEEKNAKILIVNMNTYGGGVETADSIRTAILKAELPVYMLVNNNAASAGALISIACDKIFMTPGSSIGAATVVTQDGAPAIDKYQSYFRSKMRATAEVTGRDPDIAEAMVDEDIEIEGITKKGKLLTFTVSEAITHNFCDGEVDDLSDLLKSLQLDHYTVYTYQPTTVSTIISFLVHPMISGLLIMLMLGGIYFELQSPGIGFPITASLVAATLFFAPLYLQGMAENWEIIIFFVGLVLLAAEILVIPGTGITGILGVIFIFTGLTLSLLENVQFDFSFVSMDQILTSFSIVMISTISMAVVGLVMLPKILSSARFKPLILESSQKVDDGFIGVDPDIHTFIGKSGYAISDLRPAGKVRIDSIYLDACSLGSFITKDTQVIVVATEGAQIVVKEI